MPTYTSTPATGINITLGGINTSDWTNPFNVSVGPSAGSTAKATFNISAKNTGYLYGYNFNSNVSGTDTINGISVTFHKFASGGMVGSPTIYDFFVALSGSFAGSSNNYASANTLWPLGSGALFTYGSSSDMWGLSGVLTPTIVNSSGFGFVVQSFISGSLNGESANVNDYIMNIYTSSAGASKISGNFPLFLGTAVQSGLPLYLASPGGGTVPLITSGPLNNSGNFPLFISTYQAFRNNVYTFYAISGIKSSLF